MSNATNTGARFRLLYNTFIDFDVAIYLYVKFETLSYQIGIQLAIFKVFI